MGMVVAKLIKKHIICCFDVSRQQYVSLIPIFKGKPYKILGSRRTIMLSKHGEIPTCEGAMPSIRWGKPMLSSNEKPCKTTRKPTNYSYGKASTCEGKKKNTLDKVGKVKHILS